MYKYQPFVADQCSLMFKMIHCVGPLVFHGGKIPNSHLATRFPTRSSTVCMWSVWMVLLASLMSMSLGSLGWHVEAGWKCPGAMEILICRFCRFPRSKWLYRFRSAESTIYVYKCMYIYIYISTEGSHLFSILCLFARGYVNIGSMWILWSGRYPRSFPTPWRIRHGTPSGSDEGELPGVRVMDSFSPRFHVDIEPVGCLGSVWRLELQGVYIYIT